MRWNVQSLVRFGAVGLAFAATPAFAAAGHRLTLGVVFGDADPTMKLLMVGLILAILGALAVTAVKLMSGPRLSGGSAFISGLRLGGPLVGLTGAAFVMLMMTLGIANAGVDVPAAVLAPGFAEAALLFMLGVMTGLVGVVCHSLIEARIDRAVLKS